MSVCETTTPLNVHKYVTHNVEWITHARTNCRQPTATVRDDANHLVRNHAKLLVREYANYPNPEIVVPTLTFVVS